MPITQSVLRYFSPNISKALCTVNAQTDEIRLRTDKPLSITTSEGYFFVSSSGILTHEQDKALKVTAEDIKHTFEAVCGYSVHSCQSMISKGFVTVAGGHRAGLCGTAVYSEKGSLETLKYINGINFRITREITGAAEKLAHLVTEASPKSILLFGEPCSGKTTVLRDLCRIAGENFPVALIDERGEIASCSAGKTGNNIGANTDVYNGYTKHDGIISAIRSMSPRMIICDEIGTQEDIAALETAHISGVKIAAAMHGGRPEDIIISRAYRLLTCKAVQYAVHIKDRQIKNIYTAEEITKRANSIAKN